MPVQTPNEHKENFHIVFARVIILQSVLYLLQNALEGRRPELKGNITVAYKAAQSLTGLGEGSR